MAHIFRIFILFITFLAIPALHALANDAFQQAYKRPLKQVDPIPEQEFLQKTIEIEKKPYDSDSLGFKVRIPENWTDSFEQSKSAIDLDEKVETPIAKFFGPVRPGARTQMVIKASKLSYTMPAEHWAIRYIISRGISIDGFQEIDDTRVVFTYVWLQDDATYMTKALVQTNGDYVMLIESFVPAEIWEKEKSLQESMVNSFQVKEKITSQVEEMLEYQFLDVAKIKYPATWNIKTIPITTIDKMSIELLNRSKVSVGYDRMSVLDGRMEVTLMNYFVVNSPQEELQKLKDNITKDGLVIEKELPSFDIAKKIAKSLIEYRDIIDYFDLNITRINGEEGKTINYEYWVATIEVGDYFYFITLFTPSREDDFFKWSRNTAGFRNVVSKFSPNKESLVYEK